MMPVATPPPTPPAWVQPAPRYGVGPALHRAPLRDRDDPGDDVSDFNRGDVEVRLRLGFGGNSYGPQTLITAFFNWTELQVSVDAGLLEVEYLTVGVGAEAWIARPVLPESVSDLPSAAGADLAWRAASRGAALRLTAHYTWLSSFDPYAVVVLGLSSETVRGARSDLDAVGRDTSLGLRVGGGAGVTVVSEDRITGGLELRYLLGARLNEGQGIPLRLDDGTAVDTFSVGRAQRPPRGFHWVAFVGYRF